MKKTYFLALLMFVFLTAGAGNLTAQVPGLPKIPKPKKTEPAATPAPKADDTEASSKDDEPLQLEQSEGFNQPQDEWADNPAIRRHTEMIKETTGEVEKYDPQEHLYMVDRRGMEYVMRAVSTKVRDKWFKDMGLLEYRKSPSNKMDVALDQLAEAVKEKMPLNVPKAPAFAFKSASEETMMKSKLTNMATLKIFKIGLAQGTWQIDKGEIGIPNARYKQGYIYARDSADDHPYCHFYQVNIIQEYSGGGTYAASYARLIQDSLVGCPAQ